MTQSDATKKSVQEDNRKNHRVPIQVLVDYKADGSYLFDFCKDLGAGGVFIETSTPLSQGSTVELTFTIPDSKETLQAEGEVIWVQQADSSQDFKPGMGVQFKAFSSEQRQSLNRFVERYSQVTDNGKGSPKSA
jgi:type IV pilus assembly protein PilZ